ncbi:sigma-70 family RNA polymerase sigma factor [Zunongwangia atlantica]|uniref:RNA polymerase sigma-70 region 2 domain-containing protein n=1 Tax=Zunongwangia atlantica 22II14-10F7 TaxID=1185767 RepID=A0A1Y1T489_9FLAO|nr:sigma-70 family RNA polymerase sigma factor [Zunongwangia atlantica]ORL45404.1 hypothetical protein IIF7_11298 [Zunongwangia atlantica 22II14-10F7]
MNEKIDINSDECKKIIHHVIGKLHYPHHLREELISEAYLHLHQASLKFDSSKHSKFYSYAYTTVWNNLIRFLKSENKIPTYSADFEKDENEDVTINEILYAPDDHQAIEDKNLYNSTLEKIDNPIHRFIFQRFFEESMCFSRIKKMYGEIIEIKSDHPIEKIIKKYTPKLND